MDLTQPAHIKIICHKCSHPHVFNSLQELNDVPPSTPCENCGFLYIFYNRSKMEAMTILLETDAKAAELLVSDDHDKLNEYVFEKTGIR